MGQLLLARPPVGGGGACNIFVTFYFWGAFAILGFLLFRIFQIWDA